MTVDAASNEYPKWIKPHPDHVIKTEGLREPADAFKSVEKTDAAPTPVLSVAAWPFSVERDGTVMVLVKDADEEKAALGEPSKAPKADEDFDLPPPKDEKSAAAEKERDN